MRMSTSIMNVFSISDILSQILNYSGIMYSLDVMSSLVISCSDMINYVQKCCPYLRCVTLDDRRSSLISRLSGLNSLYLESLSNLCHLNIRSIINISTLYIHNNIIDEFMLSSEWPEIFKDIKSLIVEDLNITKSCGLQVYHNPHKDMRYNLDYPVMPSFNIFTKLRYLRYGLAYYDNLDQLESLCSLEIRNIILRPEDVISINKSKIRYLCLNNVESRMYGDNIEYISCSTLKIVDVMFKQYHHPIPLILDRYYLRSMRDSILFKGYTINAKYLELNGCISSEIYVGNCLELEYLKLICCDDVIVDCNGVDPESNIDMDIIDCSRCIINISDYYIPTLSSINIVNSSYIQAILNTPHYLEYPNLYYLDDKYRIYIRDPTWQEMIDDVNPYCSEDEYTNRFNIISE